MNRTYELMFIVRPDMVEEDQDKLISTLGTAVTSSGGLVKSVEKMASADWLIRLDVSMTDLRPAHRRRQWRAGSRTGTALASYRAGDQFLSVRIDESKSVSIRSRKFAEDRARR